MANCSFQCFDFDDVDQEREETFNGNGGKGTRKNGNKILTQIIGLINLFTT
jgi:hypothetical protein